MSNPQNIGFIPYIVYRKSRNINKLYFLFHYQKYSLVHVRHFKFILYTPTEDFRRIDLTPCGLQGKQLFHQLFPLYPPAECVQILSWHGRLIIPLFQRSYCWDSEKVIKRSCSLSRKKNGQIRDRVGSKIRFQ